MPATGREGQFSALTGLPSRLKACAVLSALTLVFAATARADAHADVVDLVASMTAALSDNNAPGFFKALDKTMPGYDRLRAAIPALLAQGDIASSVQPLSDDGDAARRSLELDWYMEIRNVDETAPVVRRRQVVRCVVEKQNGHWRITSLDPLSFFEPETFTHK